MGSVDNLIKSLFKNIRVRTDFKIKDGVLVKYKGKDEKVEIPDSVKLIGYYAFYNCSSLKEITIPNSVTKIGTGAFNECSSLKKIFAPECLDLSDTGYPKNCKIIRY